MKDDLSINWHFKRLYQEQGLSLDALAERTGVPRGYLSQYANGRLNLTYDEKLRVANALNTNVSDLAMG